MVHSPTVGPRAYRSGHDIHSRQRALAFGGVIALHVAVIGVFYFPQLKAPPPAERILTVSFVSEAPDAPAPAPPQPSTPPPPKSQMLATASPTPSPMTAPTIEEQRPQVAQAQAAAPSPQPPSPGPSSDAPAEAAVTPPSFRAAYLNNPGPAYPNVSRRKREEGTVRLRVQVSPEGAPVQVLLDRSSNFSDLDSAAMDVVKKRWRFEPAKQGDRAVVAWVIVPMEFSLKSR
jgi:protein TonB